jgi:hypothetical protein
MLRLKTLATVYMRKAAGTACTISVLSPGNNPACTAPQSISVRDLAAKQQSLWGCLQAQS